MKALEELFGPAISVYTREQAIEDGVLVDVTEMAQEAGIVFPVAVTRRLWDEYIEPNEFEESWGQSVEGRLWDVLWMFRVNALKRKGSQILYQVIFARQAAGGRKRMVQKTVTLKAVVSAEGPAGGPCITIMLPDED